MAKKYDLNKMSKRILNKYRAIQHDFNEMYHSQGLRTEVIYEALEKKYYLGFSSLYKIVSLDLPDADPIEDPDQLHMFNQNEKEE